MLLTNLRQKWRKRHYKKQDGKCYYCSVDMVLESIQSRSNECTLDHKIPLSRGGEDHWENTCAACKRCNQKKGALTEAEFLGLIGRKDDLTCTGVNSDVVSRDDPDQAESALSG
jgi:5-methylcytosine-specific restriction endonuclease McrA